MADQYEEMPKGPYTVQQLIDVLQKCKNKNAPVNVYLLDSFDSTEFKTCGRYPVMFVDDDFENNRMVDLAVADLPYLEERKPYDDRTEVDHNG